MSSRTLAAIAERRGFPRPACGERATRAERKPDLGPVRGRFHKLRLAETPPHPDLLPARGEKETAVRRGHVRNKRQSHHTRSGRRTPTPTLLFLRFTRDFLQALRFSCCTGAAILFAGFDRARKWQ